MTMAMKEELEDKRKLGRDIVLRMSWRQGMWKPFDKNL